MTKRKFHDTPADIVSGGFALAAVATGTVSSWGLFSHDAALAVLICVVVYQCSLGPDCSLCNAASLLQSITQIDREIQSKHC